MYKKHFGLNTKPFSLLSDPGFLYFSDKHKTAFTILEYGLMEQTGITVITGEVGSGKTTLVNHLMNRVSSDELTLGVINNTHQLMGTLLQLIALAFNVEHEGLDSVALFKSLQTYFLDEYAAGRRVVLIVDEAQNMNENALEELRMLTNINSGTDQLLQLILVGQPELFDMLTQHRMRQFAQRVSSEYHLKALGRKETNSYIHSRTKRAGAEQHLFEKAATTLIFYFSGGVPRLINALADEALVHAYAMDVKIVSFAIVLESVKNKRIGGIQRFGIKSRDSEKTRELLEKMTGVDVVEALQKKSA